jgi:signal transduction histidine kinase
LFSDKQAIQHIIVNLLTNAFKFCQAGTVTLEIRGSGQNDLYLAVSDDGIGMDQQHLEKIFQPFFQVSHGTTRKFGGSGLGLSIVKKIVGEMNGKILVESQIGQGSKFEVFLPEVIHLEK